MMLTLSLSIVIGLLLGLLGGGGSVLTVPMLVYLLHIEPKLAIITSFVVVGVSSLMALLPHARRGTVCWKSGMYFGATGMLGAFCGGRLAGHFSGEMLMSLFGAISLLTGILMLRRSKTVAASQHPAQRLKVCPLQVPYLRVLFDGFFVGAVTGMVGMGGGFLIVPALTLLVGLPMQGAIGTSLFVIVLNAIAGLSGYSQFVTLDLNLTAVVAAGAVVGSAIGGMYSSHVNPVLLRRGFAVLVMLVAVYTLWQSLSWSFIERFTQWLALPDNVELGLGGLALAVVVVRIGVWIHKTEAVMFTPPLKLPE